jgi:FkbM family methyltransferase
MLRLVANWALDKVRPLFRWYHLGRHTILLPKGSPVKNILRYHRRYDFALGPISSTIAAKYPHFCAIDIGANVGDTAAIICRDRDVPVLCIEGDTAVLPLLRANAGRIGPQIVIEEVFVGAEGDVVDLTAIEGGGLNATLTRAANDASGQRLPTLAAILERHPAFRTAKLLKIDTEGYDFRIIESSRRFLAAAKPVVFFEYNPWFHAPNLRAGVATIEMLLEIGYNNAIVYDNHGNFMLSLSGGDMTERFNDLNAFLASNRRFGAAVGYIDVCAIHVEDSDLHAAIREGELTAVLDEKHGGKRTGWTPPPRSIWFL